MDPWHRPCFSPSATRLADRPRGQAVNPRGGDPIMLKKFRNRQSDRQKGFTLIELLIVVAIIGIIAALLIPNFLDALQKAKQKRTVADERNLGTAMFSWLTDQLGAAAAGAVTTVTMANYTTISSDNLRLILVPQYVQSIPAKDGWKHDYV